MKILMVIAFRQFRDEEYLEPLDIFKAAGCDVATASSLKGICLGKLGASVKAAVAIDEVDAGDYDAVLFIGGSGAEEYFENRAAHKIAADAVAQGKLLGAICCAPVILANAGLLTGKKATVFAGDKDSIVSKGVLYTGADVEIDGMIVTASGPSAATKFAETVLKMLRGK